MCVVWMCTCTLCAYNYVHVCVHACMYAFVCVCQCVCLNPGSLSPYQMQPGGYKFNSDAKFNSVHHLTAVIVNMYSYAILL